MDERLDKHTLPYTRRSVKQRTPRHRNIKILQLFRVLNNLDNGPEPFFDLLVPNHIIEGNIGLFQFQFLFFSFDGAFKGKVAMVPPAKVQVEYPRIEVV